MRLCVLLLLFCAAAGCQKESAGNGAQIRAEGMLARNPRASRDQFVIPYIDEIKKTVTNDERICSRLDGILFSIRETDRLQDVHLTRICELTATDR